VQALMLNPRLSQVLPQRPVLSAALVCSLTLMLLVPGSADAATRPSGAVKLQSALMKTVGKVKCGKIKGAWLPGTALSGRYFVSHSQQAKNYKSLAKKKRGSAKKKATKQSADYAAKAKSQLSACRKTSTAPAPPQSNALRFNISSAQALVLSSTAVGANKASAKISSGSSNLAALLPSGQLQDAVSQGSVLVGLVAPGPGGKIYVWFSRGVNLEDSTQLGAGACRFAEVDRNTGVPVCIDSSLSHFGELSTGNPSVRPPAGGWVQFDSAGNVYYRGYGTPLSGASMRPSVLRRWSNGTVTDLVNSSDVRISDFQVLPDGGVLVSGSTLATGQEWLRRVNASGGLQTVRNASGLNLGVFPDGNVYWGMWATGNFGVRRYLTSLGQIEEKMWIGDRINSETPESYFKPSEVCPQSNPVCESFAGYFGSFAQTFMPGDGTVFAVAGTLFKYYPTVERVDTSVARITIAEAAGRDLILAGLDSQGRNVLVTHSTATGSETQLLSPGDEVEIYHLSFAPTSGKVIYDGLRFSDNKIIMGEIDLASRTASVSTTLSAKPASVEGL